MTMTVTQCEILVFFNVNNLISKARCSTSSGTIFRSHQSFHFYYCSESSEGTHHFYFLCKAAKFHIKQCVHSLYAELHPPQTTVDAVCCVLCLLPPSLCFHACKQLVESCVSAWCLCWRELRSITGWGCYPGAWAQPCTVISPHLPSLLWQAAQGRAFKLPPPENIRPFLYTLWKTNTFELEGKNIHRQFSISQQSVFNKWQCGKLETEPRTGGCISVQLSVGIMKQLWEQVTDLISACPHFLRWTTAAFLRSQSRHLHIIRRQEAARFSNGFLITYTLNQSLHRSQQENSGIILICVISVSLLPQVWEWQTDTLWHQLYSAGPG